MDRMVHAAFAEYSAHRPGSGWFSGVLKVYKNIDILFTI